MALDGVAWLIGGGAEHSPEVGRALAHLASHGSNGVVLPGDLKVSALSTPGTKVRFAPGVCAILNSNPGARGESYIGRAPSETQVDVTAAGAGGRNDVLILRVEDPQYAPWSAPADPKVGPYLKAVLLTGISSGNIATIKSTKSLDVLGLTYPAIGLATIEIPASTGTITNAMITDIRQLAAARAKSDVSIVAPAINQTLDSVSGEVFPTETISVAIPKWATDMAVKVDLASVGHVTNVCEGVFQIVVSPTDGERRVSPQIVYDLPAPAAGGERRSLVLAGNFDVRSIAGTTRAIRLEATRASGAGSLVTRAGTQVIFDVRFSEKVV